MALFSCYRLFMKLSGPVEFRELSLRGARGAFGLILVLLAGFFWLRIATGQYGFWIDEYYTLIFADEPLSHLWGAWMVQETNPPLFYSMVKAWQVLGFMTVDQLRLLPELGGVVGLALLGIAAAIGWGPKAALPAVVLAGLSAQYVHASQLLRGYIFAADGITLATIGLLLSLRSLGAEDRSVRRLAPALYVGGSTLAIYCHTTMLLWPVVATLALPIASGRHWWPALRAIVLMNVAVAILSGWWIWITLRQLTEHVDNADWIVGLSHHQFSWVLSQNALLINEVTPADHRLSKLVALAAIGGSLLAIRQPATRLVLAMAAIGAGTFELAQFIHPIVTPITLFWLSTFVVLLIAAGLGAIRQPVLSGGLLLILSGVLGTNLALRGSRVTPEDFTSGIRVAAEHPQAALLVEGAGSGATAAKACAIEYPGQPCPVRIITLMCQSASNRDPLSARKRDPRGVAWIG